MRRIKPVIKLFPHQYEYVTSSHLHPAIIAGYGSGKTYANIQRILALLERRHGKAYIFYAAPTFDLISSSFLPAFLETLDSYGIKYKTNKQEHLITILDKEIAGVVKYLSLDNYKHLVAFTATDGILDEFDVIQYDRQKPIWTRALARLRGCKDATLSITSTPEGFKFCYELQQAGKIKQIKAKSTDNKSLPESFIEEMLSNYDEAHQQMYINGEYVNLTGLQAIYAFSRDKAIPELLPSEVPSSLTVGMDFNVDPFCMTISCMMNGNKITFDELFIRNQYGSGNYASFTDKAMMILLQRYPNQWYKQHIDSTVERVFDIAIRPDWTGDHRKTVGNLTDIEIIRKYGVRIDGTANPSVLTRLKVANVAMNTGRWFVCENCVNLIKDLEMCVTDSYGELVKTKEKERTHLLDAVTYDTAIEFMHLVLKPQKGKMI